MPGFVLMEFLAVFEDISAAFSGCTVNLIPVTIREKPVYTFPRNAGTENEIQMSMQGFTFITDFITEAVSTLDRFTTGGLIELSHRRGTPWFEVWNSGKGKCREIPIESIRQYFTHEQ